MSAATSTKLGKPEIAILVVCWSFILGGIYLALWYFRGTTTAISHIDKTVDDTALIAEIITKAKRSDCQPVSFATLGSYRYEIPASLEGPLKDQIPAEIRALDGKKVAVRGYLVPTELKKGKTTKFLLACRDDFHPMPRMNEWIIAQSEIPIPAVQDRPITIFGTLRVGEEIKDGEVFSIYRLAADGSDILMEH